MMTYENGRTVNLKVTRDEVIRILIMTNRMPAEFEDGTPTSWKALHDKIREQLDAFDAKHKEA